MCGSFECGAVFFFQAEDGIRDLVRSRGLGDVYKRQSLQTLGLMERTGKHERTDFHLYGKN